MGSLGGWVGGWVVELSMYSWEERGGRGGWNELLWVVGGWVGGWVGGEIGEGEAVLG